MSQRSLRCLISALAAPSSLLLLGLMLWLLLPQEEMGSVELFRAAAVIGAIPSIVIASGAAWWVASIYGLFRGSRAGCVQACNICGGEMNNIHTGQVAFSVCKACGMTYKE